VFLERVSQLASESKHGPRSVNTWGDAVYAIFDFAYDAGCFALELAEMILEGREDWINHKLYSEGGLDEDGEPIQYPLNVRIGLHTGPVFMHYDPVVRRLGFTGEHVNRAARIEPIAKPGEVFASEEFAALAELGAEIRRRARPDGADEDNGFVCEYAGSRALAKNFPGRFRIYRVLPKRAFVIERLAQAAHESYYAEALKRGETPQTNSSLREWDKLPTDLKDANRAQVADIPVKLRMIGYELAPGHGLRASRMPITSEQTEILAMHEHERWMADRIRHGWTYAPKRDNETKKHPCLVEWAKLSDVEKEKDRAAVRNMPLLIEQAGFRVRRIPERK
jgi:class 3 adenylate cyclase